MITLKFEDTEKHYFLENLRLGLREVTAFIGHYSKRDSNESHVYVFSRKHSFDMVNIFLSVHTTA